MHRPGWFNVSFADLKQWRSSAHVESLHSPSNRAASMGYNRRHRCNTVGLCVLCRWVSQIYMSYPSMSGYICGTERVPLFMTQCRRMTADKWIRSVTVTVASGGRVRCVCVCQSSWVRMESLYVVMLRWPLTPHPYRCTHTHFFVSHILSLQTQLLSRRFCPLFLQCEITLNEQICKTFIWMSL